MLQQEIHHELVCHCNGRGIESLVWIGEAASPASVFLHGIGSQFGSVVRTISFAVASKLIGRGKQLPIYHPDGQTCSKKPF